MTVYSFYIFDRHSTQTLSERRSPMTLSSRARV